MAEEPIRKEDIIDSEGIVKGIDTIIDALNKLIEKELELIKVSRDAVKSANPATPEGQNTIKETSSSIDEVIPKVRDYSNAISELSRRKTELINNQSLSNKEFAAQVKSLNSAEKALNSTGRATEGAEDSINKLRAKLKELTAEYNKMDAATRDKVAPGIKKLTDELKKAESAIGNNTRNVGNYSDALKNLGGKIVDAGKSLLGFGGIAGVAALAFTKVKDAIFETVAGVDLLTQASEVSKQFFSDLINFGRIDAARLSEANKLGKEANKIREGDRVDLIEVAVLQRDVNKARFEAANAELSETSKIDALNKTLQKHNELIDYQINDKKEDLSLIEKRLKLRPNSEKLLQSEAQLLANIINLEAERAGEMRRVESTVTGLEQKRIKNLETIHNGLIEAADQQVEIDKTAAASAQKLALEKERAANNAIQKVGLAEKEKALVDVKYDQVKVGTAISVSGQLVDIKKKEITETQAAAQANADFDKELNLEVTKEKMDNVQMYLKFASDAINILTDITNRNKERELSAAGDNAVKREAIEKEYFKKQKALNIAQALMNGALAITNIIATAPGSVLNPASWVAIGITSAMTAVQMAVIAAQKFAEGGEIFGKSHAQGGTHIEAEGGEYVVKKTSTSKYKGLIEAINEDNPMRIAEEIRNRNFHTVWGGVSAQLSTVSKQDPYTRMMYELMKNDIKTYLDTNGDTVLCYPDGSKRVVRKYKA